MPVGNSRMVTLGDITAEQLKMHRSSISQVGRHKRQVTNPSTRNTESIGDLQCLTVNKFKVTVELE